LGYRVTYVLGTKGALRERAIKTLLATLTMVDRAYLEAHPETPPLYKSGLRYEEEPGEQDDWKDIPTLFKDGGGDSEDLACLRAAELQLQGYDAWPTFEKHGSCLHPRVRIVHPKTGAVTFEDPAQILGMKSHSKPCMAFDNGGPETRITFVIDVFKGIKGGEVAQAVANRTLQLMLSALTMINVDFLKVNPSCPRLYDLGVRYEIEPAGREDWQDIPTTIRRKTGDCEDLSSHLAAELQVKDGIAAWPTFTWRMRPSGAYLYHVLTRYPDGRIEDPSRRLGMGRNADG